MIFVSLTKQRGCPVHRAPLLPLGVVEDLSVARRVVALERLGLEHRHVRPDYLDTLGGGTAVSRVSLSQRALYEGIKRQETQIGEASR